MERRCYRFYKVYKKIIKQILIALLIILQQELNVLFLPLVENIARKFSTSQQSSGVMSIMDMIQAGSQALTLSC